MERDISAKLGGNKLDDFNSHAHVERDEGGHVILDPSEISTHTLTWSVTVPNLGLTNAQNISTHTLTWSVTGSIMAVFPYKIFQLTRSRGA